MRRPTYTAEFKADAVAFIHREGRSIRQVAEDLGVSPWSVRDWYRQDMAKKKKGAVSGASGALASAGPANETPEAKVARLERENQLLRKQVDSLRTDREILKKAAAFFAKESE